MIDSALLRKWSVVPRLFFLLCLVTGSAAAQPPAGTASDPEIENKISSLLAHMTLAEKLGQLQQLDGTWDGDVRPEQMELARQGLLGSAIYVRGAKRTTELQRVAMNGIKAENSHPVFVRCHPRLSHHFPGTARRGRQLGSVRG